MTSRRRSSVSRRRNTCCCFPTLTFTSSAGHDLSDLAAMDVAATSEGEDVLLVHPNVPTATSERLGVPTLMSRMLEAEELDLRFVVRSSY